VLVELFAELLDFFLCRHAGGGGIVVAFGVPGETEEIEGRRDASLREIDHAIVHEHEGLPAGALPCLLVSLAVAGNDGLDLPIPEIVQKDVAGDTYLTYEGAINLVGGSQFFAGAPSSVFSAASSGTLYQARRMKKQASKAVSNSWLEASLRMVSESAGMSSPLGV
jgi:hypothetical protein